MIVDHLHYYCELHCNGTPICPDSFRYFLSDCLEFAKFYCEKAPSLTPLASAAPAIASCISTICLSHKIKQDSQIRVLLTSLSKHETFKDILKQEETIRRDEKNERAEKKRLAAEAENKKQAEKARLDRDEKNERAEKKRLAAEAENKKQAEKARLDRAEKKKQAKEARLDRAEKKKQAEEARLDRAEKKKQAEEARLDGAEKERLAAEAEEARLARAEKERLAAEAEKERLAAEAEKKRLAAEAKAEVEESNKQATHIKAVAKEDKKDPINILKNVVNKLRKGCKDQLLIKTGNEHVEDLEKKNQLNYQETHLLKEFKKLIEDVQPTDKQADSNDMVESRNVKSKKNRTTKSGTSKEKK